MKAILECPHCGGQAFTDYGDGLVACQRCYTQFDLNQQQCPRCGTLLVEGISVCVRCGAHLQDDLVETTIKERLTTPKERRRARLATVQQVRAVQEDVSRQRLDAWWEQDQERQQKELEAQKVQQSRERRFIVIAALIIAIIVLFVALASWVLLSVLEPAATPIALYFVP